jgi:hypothetical protein
MINFLMTREHYEAWQEFHKQEIERLITHDSAAERRYRAYQARTKMERAQERAALQERQGQRQAQTRMDVVR